jgi:hypothetical protein
MLKKTIVLITLLLSTLAITSITLVVASGDKTPLDIQRQKIEDLDAKIKELDALSTEVVKKLAKIDKSLKKTQRMEQQVQKLLTKLGTSGEEVKKLTDAVSVSEDGTIGIGKASSTARLDVGGRIMADIVSFGHHTMKIETVIKNGKVQEDLTIPLGSFKNGNAYQIQVYIAGGWAEAGGIYHIVGDWGYLPTMNLRSESTKLQERLKFHAKKNGEGWYWLTATWDNISPDREPWVNDVYFVITGVNFDTTNTTEFVKFTELSTKLEFNGDVRIGLNTSDEQSKTSTYGNELSFLGAHNNSDPLWMARYNLSSNDSELRINVGDDGNDNFSVGYTYHKDGKWRSYLTVDRGSMHVAGKVHAKEFVQSSDKRLKQNIQPLVSSLAKLAQLRGVSFKWKDEPQDNQIGLVAQEVEKILPEIVSTDSEGYKSIAYGKLTAVLLEAIKEQQQQIDELNKRLEQK